MKNAIAYFAILVGFFGSSPTFFSVKHRYRKMFSGEMPLKPFFVRLITASVTNFDRR